MRVIGWRQKSTRLINTSNDVIRFQCENAHAFLISRTLVWGGKNYFLSSLFFYSYGVAARGIKKTVELLLVTCYLFLYYFGCCVTHTYLDTGRISLDSSTVTWNRVTLQAFFWSIASPLINTTLNTMWGVAFLARTLKTHWKTLIF